MYFSFAVSSDVPPDEIMARVTVDWNLLGGTRLAVKNLGVFDTVTPVVIYFLWNEGHADTILHELKQILSEFLPILIGGGGEQETLPPMALRKQIPRIPGQITSDFQNLSFRAQMARRAWHVEVERRHVPSLLKLVEAAKSTGMIEAMWGRQAHITEAADINTSPGELKRFVKFAQRHVNFHCSMTCDDLKGITALDSKIAAVDKATGTVEAEISLRDVLLRKFKLADGTSLIAEVHQRGPMGSVDVIVPNIPEAEAMILMMNRHFPAFCWHYLTDNGMEVDFVNKLLHESCCPTLVSEIKKCTWDPKLCSISTAAQVAEEARLREMENAAWYKDEFRSMVAGVKKVKSYADAEALYTLDGARSITTLHARNDNRAAAAKKRKGNEMVDMTHTDSDLSASSTDKGTDDDVSMDSASSKLIETPKGKVVADSGTSSRVRFTHRTPTSSVDESAPQPSAGGG